MKEEWRISGSIFLLLSDVIIHFYKNDGGVEAVLVKIF